MWRNVLTNMSDFKELVPEFYDSSQEGDFLENRFGIHFGYRHDGSRVNDVALPPWASGKHFENVPIFLKGVCESLNFMNCNLSAEMSK